MSWFDTSNFASLAKTALNQAQKSIDKVLDIEQTDDEVNATSKASVTETKRQYKPQQTVPSLARSPSSINRAPDRAPTDVKSPIDKVEEDSLWSSFPDEKHTSPKKARNAGQKTHRSNKLGARRQNSKDDKTKEWKRRNELTSSDATDACGTSKITSADEGTRECLRDEGQEGFFLGESEIGFIQKAENKRNELSIKPTGKEDSDAHIISDSIIETRPLEEEFQQLNKGSDEDNVLSRLHSTSIKSSTLRGEEISEHLVLRDNETSFQSQSQIGIDVEVLELDGKANEEHHGLLSQRNSTGVGFDVHVPEDNIESMDLENVLSHEEPIATSTPFHSQQRTLSAEGLSTRECVPTNDKSTVRGDGMLTDTLLEERERVPTNDKSTARGDGMLTETLLEERNHVAEESHADEVSAAMIVDMEKSAAQNEQMTGNTEVEEVQGESGKEVELVATHNQGEVTIETGLLQNEVKSEMDESMESGDSDTEKEIANLKQVLQVRESKLFTVSKENVDLQETNSILRNQLAQLEAVQRADDAEIEELRQEFTKRVAATESKFQLAAKERDQLKKTLEEQENSFSALNSKHQEEYTTLIAEKDEQITQLLEEGEKLSKQQLQSNNIIKKLRTKEKESDTLIKKQSKKLEEFEAEVAQLRDVVMVKDESGKVQEEGILKQNAYVKDQDELLSKQKSELDDATEKIRSMQAALDNAYKELTELHKEMASEESNIQASVLSAEMVAKEELRIALERCRKENAQEEEMLALQITDLRTLLSRSEQQTARREDNLRQEISDLQQRLQEAEARNQELTESVTLATRPLLRQIENLQSTYSGQAATLEKVEKNLTNRLNDSQIALAFAQERERATTEHSLELNTRLSTLESQLATYRQDKSRVEALLEMERSRFETAEEGRSRETARLDALHVKYKKMIEDANLEKTLLEQQLAIEKGKLETEKVRTQALLEEKGKLLVRQSSFSGVPPSSPAQSSTVSQNESTDIPPYRALVRQSSSSSGVLDGLSRSAVGAGTALVERLQAQVKQKEGEVELLQDDAVALERSRDAVTQELASLTSKLENLECDKVEFERLQVHHQELRQRHNAVLQMYGEKEEEAEELKLDLEDVKSMYKAQIEELLRSSNW